METIPEDKKLSASLSSGKTTGEDVGSADLPVEFDKLTELDMWIAPIYWGEQMLKEIKRLQMQLENVQFAIKATRATEKPYHGYISSDFYRGWEGALDMIEGAMNAKQKLTES